MQWAQPLCRSSMVHEISLIIKLLLPLLVKGGNYYPSLDQQLHQVVKLWCSVHQSLALDSLGTFTQHQASTREKLRIFSFPSPEGGRSDCRLKAITMHNTPTISSHLGTLCQKVLECSEKTAQTVLKNFLFFFLLLLPPSTSKHSSALHWPTGLNCNTAKVETDLHLHPCKMD